MDPKQLIKEVRDHAMENYNKGGWDILVECWEDEDILFEAGLAPNRWGDKPEDPPVSSLDQALDRIEKILKLQDDHRKDIESTAF